MIHNRMQIQKHEAPMVTETVTSMRKSMGIDENRHRMHQLHLVVDGAPTSKKEGDDRSGNLETATANEFRTGSAGTTYHHRHNAPVMLQTSSTPGSQ
jgi:hypothetical protein